MRITKKFLREQVSAMRFRIRELCAGLVANGNLEKELLRVFPAYGISPQAVPEQPGEQLRQLLESALERCFPNHIID